TELLEAERQRQKKADEKHIDGRLDGKGPERHALHTTRDPAHDKQRRNEEDRRTRDPPRHRKARRQSEEDERQDTDGERGREERDRDAREAVGWSQEPRPHGDDAVTSSDGRAVDARAVEPDHDGGTPRADL